MRILHLLLAFMLFMIAPARAWEAPSFPEAKIIAVSVFADWCPNCKILGPALEQARTEGKLGELPVLFVTLDYTDKTTIHQSKLLGKALGLEAFMKAGGSGTGYVALLEAKTKQEVARFDRETKAQEITSKIKKHIKDESKH